VDEARNASLDFIYQASREAQEKYLTGCESDQTTAGPKDYKEGNRRPEGD